MSGSAGSAALVGAIKVTGAVETVEAAEAAEAAKMGDAAAPVEAEKQTGPVSERDAPTRIAGGASGILGRFKTNAARNVVVFAALLGVYLALSLPFKVLSVIPGFTDIRPVEMLQPVYGIFFGIPGCFAFAVGNLVGDIMSDSLRWSSVAGFIACFSNAFLMYLFWCKLRKSPFNLRRGRTLVLMVVLMVAFAVLQAAIIAPAVGYFYPGVDMLLLAVTIICNDTAFPLCFGIPLMVLMQEELGFKPLSRQRERK
jgi:energy-coupling factor transport system substrate-specific component